MKTFIEFMQEQRIHNMTFEPIIRQLVKAESFTIDFVKFICNSSASLEDTLLAMEFACKNELLHKETESGKSIARILIETAVSQRRGEPSSGADTAEQSEPPTFDSHSDSIHGGIPVTWTSALSPGSNLDRLSPEVPDTESDAEDSSDHDRHHDPVEPDSATDHNASWESFTDDPGHSGDSVYKQPSRKGKEPQAQRPASSSTESNQPATHLKAKLSRDQTTAVFQKYLASEGQTSIGLLLNPYRNGIISETSFSDVHKRCRLTYNMNMSILKMKKLETQDVRSVRKREEASVLYSSWHLQPDGLDRLITVHEECRRQIIDAKFGTGKCKQVNRTGRVTIAKDAIIKHQAIVRAVGIYGSMPRKIDQIRTQIELQLK